MIAPLLCLLLLLAPGALAQAPSPSQPGRSADWYADEAEKAVAAENYESAVRILEQGKKEYPLSFRLNVLLGNLYYDKQLFKLALAEYQAADQKQGEDFYTLSQIAHCYGKLNQEKKSIQTLEKVLELYPDSITTMDDLGWMYFKTFQLDKGETLLLEALERFGPDQGIYMTLGTLYSGLYDYESSRRYYLKAIKEAETTGDDYFSSVAYYNLSLLEHNFYHYNSALRYTEESIERADRSPGHLAKGELYLARMDFQRALAEYQRAQAKDTTPLSKVNLAILYQKFGQLELARRYAEEALRSEDLAWMYYYGTDLERHYKDIHELLADVYAGLARWEWVKPSAHLGERLLGLVRGLGYRLVSFYHRQKFRLYCLRVGRSYLEQNNLLDANWEFYRGGEGYPKVALKYLAQARVFETQVAPHSAVYYLQEEGKIGASTRLLEQTLAAFDPYWEKEGLAESLRLMVPLLKPGSAERREAAGRLYEINPGALLQYGFGLPLEVRVSLPPGRDRDGRVPHLLRFLRRAGSELAAPDSATGDARSVTGDARRFRYRLTVRLDEPGRASFQLEDGLRGAVLAREELKLPAAGPRRQAAVLTTRILEKIYCLR